MPKKCEIEKIKSLLEKVFGSLIKNDKNLIQLPLENQVMETYNDKKEYERKLHEVCINHRLAFYIEKFIKDYFTNDYYVDIEYNRYYLNHKFVDIDGEDKIVRPDIIIHTRIDKPISYPQHLLIIEAKKDIDSKNDDKKVKAFLNDKRYNYVFGMVVKYNDFNPINAKLYYKNDNGDIEQEMINYEN